MNAFYDDFPLQTLSLFLASVIPGEEFAFCAGKKVGCKMLPDNPIKPLVYEVQPYRALHPKPLQGFLPSSLWERGTAPVLGKVSSVRREVFSGVLIPNLSTKIPETRKHWAVYADQG